MAKSKWLQSAINPAHKGFCSPMSKKTCTHRRKALARRLKKGGDLYSGRKKKHPGESWENGLRKSMR